MKKVLTVLTVGVAVGGCWLLYRSRERIRLIREIILLTAARAKANGAEFPERANAEMTKLLDTWETGNLRIFHRMTQAISNDDYSALNSMTDEFKASVAPLMRERESAWEPYGRILFKI